MRGREMPDDESIQTFVQFLFSCFGNYFWQTVYQPSGREYRDRKLRQAGYPDEWEKRKVRKEGQIKWKDKDIRISGALKGLEVGLRPIAEAKWAVYFEHVELGIFDERKGRVTGVRMLKTQSAKEELK